MQAVYVECPVYETGHFCMRLVEDADAEALLACYSDRAAVGLMNSDYCSSDFYYTTLTDMRNCIRMWRDEYDQGHYVRFAILEKPSSKPVGTVEMFGGDCGVLRIDIISALEKQAYLAEILDLAVKHFYADFDAQKIAVKSIPAARERIAALTGLGFEKDESFRPGLDYYARKR